MGVASSNILSWEVSDQLANDWAFKFLEKYQYLFVTEDEIVIRGKHLYC